MGDQVEANPQRVCECDLNNAGEELLADGLLAG